LSSVAYRNQAAVEKWKESEILRDVRKCLHCGVCTASCPVFRFRKSFNPRQMIARVALGHEEVMKALEPWYCAGCYLCQERCPRDVQPSTILTLIRNMASRRGAVPQSIVEINRNVVAHGRIYEMDEFYNFLREEMGLDPIEPLEGEEIVRLIEGSLLAKVSEEA